MLGRYILGRRQDVLQVGHLDAALHHARGGLVPVVHELAGDHRCLDHLFLGRFRVF